MAYQVVEGEIRVNLTYSASGEQEEDHAFLGDSVSGTAVAVVDDDGDVRYEEVTAEVDSFDDEEDEDDVIDY